jgi:hypothetical protein
MTAVFLRLVGAKSHHHFPFAFSLAILFADLLSWASSDFYIAFPLRLLPYHCVRVKLRRCIRPSAQLSTPRSCSDSACAATVAEARIEFQRENETRR